MARTYWYHPESSSYFAADEHPGVANGMLAELDRDEYLSAIRRNFLSLPRRVRVVVFGGRSYSNQAELESALDDFNRSFGISELIEGEAPGADLRAKSWAKSRGVDIDPYHADWEYLDHPDARIKERRDGSKYDAAAGFQRNQKMIDEGKPDCGIAFPGGRGTADMKSRCEIAGIPVFEIGE